MEMTAAIIAEISPGLHSPAANLKHHLSPKLIIETVATSFGVAPQAIIGTRRDPPVALARHVAMYLMRQVADYRTRDIGRGLGNRDHSTVLYGHRRITELLPVNPELRDHVSKIIETLRSAGDFPPVNPPPVEK